METLEFRSLRYKEARCGMLLDFVGGGAWSFLVDEVICLLNCNNKRDCNLLNSLAGLVPAVHFLEGLLAQADGSLRQ